MVVKEKNICWEQEVADKLSSVEFVVTRPLKSILIKYYVKEHLIQYYKIIQLYNLKDILLYQDFFLYKQYNTVNI